VKSRLFESLRLFFGLYQRLCPCTLDSMYYRYHVFFCTNQRDGDRECCQRFGAAEIRDYAKQRVKVLGLHLGHHDEVGGKKAVRINSAGCLDRCAEGPVLVVYPEGVWYRYVDKEDVDEIIEEHLSHGRVVERLKI